jgi:tRNA(adenine34) deaminase
MQTLKEHGVADSIARREILGILALGALWTTVSAYFNPRAGRVLAASQEDIATKTRFLDHRAYMRRAIRQAQVVPKHPFGAVLVRAEDGAVVAEGHNRTSVNPTYHGEIEAINQYASLRRDGDWSDLVLYTTAEPCPMCQSAVLWAGIGTVVFGSSIPFLSKLGWWQINVRAEEMVRSTPFRRCVLVGGVLEGECNELFLAAGQARQK